MSWGKHLVSQVDLSPTLHLTEIGPTSGHCGFWLHDDTQKMNLAVRAKTREAALLEALAYYQRYLEETRAENATLREQIDGISKIIQGP